MFFFFLWQRENKVNSKFWSLTIKRMLSIANLAVKWCYEVSNNIRKLYICRIIWIIIWQLPFLLMKTSLRNNTKSRRYSACSSHNLRSILSHFWRRKIRWCTSFFFSYSFFLVFQFFWQYCRVVTLKWIILDIQFCVRGIYTSGYIIDGWRKENCTSVFDCLDL